MSGKSFEERSQASLARFEEIIRAVDETIGGGTSSVVYKDATDHFAFMTLAFLSKQRLHAQSILLLYPSRDVLLIARSMMEGLVLLLWTEADSSERALRWRSYVCVSDFRKMKESEELGLQTAPELSERILAGVKRVGDRFLTTEAKAGLLDPERDPYVHKRYPGKLARIFEAAKGEVLHSVLYRVSSDYHHWSPAGFGGSIERTGDRVQFVRDSNSDAAVAMVTGAVALLQSAEIADNHLSLGIGERLTEHRRDLEEAHKDFQRGGAAEVGQDPMGT